MSLKIPGSYRPHTPIFHFGSNHSSAPSKSQRQSSYTTCGSEFIHVIALQGSADEPPSSGPSVNLSPKARHHPYPRPKTREHSSNEPTTNHSLDTQRHPYDRVARQHPYDTAPRPEVFGAHTLLCGIKLSDTLIADRPPPKVDEYPTAPVSQIYGGNVFL